MANQPNNTNRQPAPASMPPQPMGPAPVWHPPVKKPVSPLVKTIRKTCAWIVIGTVVIAVLFSIISIWANFDGEIAGKAWSTFAVVGFGSLIIGLIAQLLDN